MSNVCTRWSELSTERLHYLCEVLRITLSTFQYKVRVEVVVLKVVEVVVVVEITHQASIRRSI